MSARWCLASLYPFISYLRLELGSTGPSLAEARAAARIHRQFNTPNGTRSSLQIRPLSKRGGHQGGRRTITPAQQALVVDLGAVGERRVRVGLHVLDR